MPSNGVIAKIAHHDLDLLFEDQILKNLYISETIRASTTICGDNCRFLHFPSNGVIDAMAHRDVDLIFEINKLKILYI